MQLEVYVQWFVMFLNAALINTELALMYNKSNFKVLHILLIPTEFILSLKVCMEQLSIYSFLTHFPLRRQLDVSIFVFVHSSLKIKMYDITIII